METAGLGNLDGLLETEVFDAIGLGSLVGFLWWSRIGSRGRNREVGSLDQSCLFGSNCCRGCDLASWAAYAIQSSVVTYGLAIVHLYSLPFRTLRERHWVSGVAFIQVSFLPYEG